MKPKCASMSIQTGSACCRAGKGAYGKINEYALLPYFARQLPDLN